MDIKLCRACLSPKGHTCLEDEYKGDALSKMLFECTGVKIGHIGDSTEPHNLCGECLQKLQDSYEFRLLCIQSDVTIRRLIEDNIKSQTKVQNDINNENRLEDFKPTKSNTRQEKKIQDLQTIAEDFQLVHKPKPKKKNRLKKHMCEVCAYCAKDSYTLKLHSNTHNPPSEKTQQCNLCNKKFSTTVLLNAHISRHKAAKSIMCELCGCRFSATAHLRAHKRSTHYGLRQFACSLCPRTFTLRSNLNVHQKIHKGIKPHVCQTCGKAFTTTSDLKGHTRSHTGEKPHVCNVCHKAFSHISNLNAHLRTHRNDNAATFKCTECDRTFSSKAYLKSHQRIHSDVRLHTCTICFSRFTHASTLKSHQTVHTGYRDHSCIHCDKKFSRVSILKAHMKKHYYEKISQDNEINSKTSIESGKEKCETPLEDVGTTNGIQNKEISCNSKINVESQCKEVNICKDLQVV